MNRKISAIELYMYAVIILWAIGIALLGNFYHVL